ncbi:MAG: hypothetical protein ACRDN9_08670 [Streptosporangiaceae bacterium]
MSLVNIDVGPANAKTITDHLAVLRPDTIVMIGHCGGLRNHQRPDDFVLATSYLRADRVLDDVLPPTVPVIPHHRLNAFLPLPHPHRHAALRLGQASARVAEAVRERLGVLRGQQTPAPRHRTLVPGPGAPPVRPAHTGHTTFAPPTSRCSEWSKARVSVGDEPPSCARCAPAGRVAPVPRSRAGG